MIYTVETGTLAETICRCQNAREAATYALANRGSEDELGTVVEVAGEDETLYFLTDDLLFEISHTGKFHGCVETGFED